MKAVNLLPEKHRPQHTRDLRLAREQPVYFIAQLPPYPRQSCSSSWVRRGNAFDQLRGAKCCYQVDILLLEVRAPVKRTFILENLRSFRLRQNCNFISRMKFQRQRLVRVRREAQPQPAFRRLEFPFELDSRKSDFVPVTPRQSRRFIAQMAMPAQRRSQTNAPLSHERKDVVCRPRLLSDAGTEASEKYPAEK